MKKEVNVYQLNTPFYKYKFYNLKKRKEECVLIIKLKIKFMII